MLSDLMYRLRAVFRRDSVERELADELQFHLEQQAAKQVRGGVSPDEANRLARLSLQGPEQTKERCRDARGTFLWDTTLQDLHYAIRQLRAAPAFALLVIAILALGIGANTAIFSFLDTVVLRSLPVRDPQQLIVPRWTAKETPHSFGIDDYESCFESRTPRPAGGCTFPYPFFTSLESRSDIFSNAAAFAGPMSLTAKAVGPAAIANAEIVSGSFFQTLGVRPALGRIFNEHDDVPEAAATVVLSYAYWKSAFAGDAFVVGKTIRLNAAPFTVIGVAEPKFNRLSPGRDCDLWLPIHAAGGLGPGWLPNPLESDHRFWLRIVARTHPGLAAARVESALTTVFRNELVFQSKTLKSESDLSIEVAPAHQALTGVRDMLEKPLYVLMGAVSLILMIACANVAGLLTARGAARRREIAIRLAVGAGRGRIVRQLLTESLLLALLGGLAGNAVAVWGISVLTHFLWVHLDVKLDVRVLLFTATISLASGVLFGILPALRSSRLPLSMSSVAPRRSFSDFLVVAQVALAVLLLVGAGLFTRTLSNLRNINPGFSPRSLLLFSLDPVSLHYTDAQIQSLYQTLRGRLAALPGVTGVTYSQSALLSDSLHSTDYQAIDGRTQHTSAPANVLAVGPDFFTTMGIPLLAGRAFTPDEFAHRRPVAVVNQAFVKQYFTGRNPLGLGFGEDEPNAVKHLIVGVAGNAKYNNLRDEIKPTAYLPLSGQSASFELRTAADPAASMAAIRKIVTQTDPNLPLFDLKTQSEQIDELLVIERLVARFSAGFGLLALTLACAGLYGLLSYEVTRRTREIGIRLAIGAQPAMVQRAILRDTFRIVLIGLALGTPTALVAARLVSAMLYGVRANDPANLLVIAVMLILVGSFAGYLPARRASLVDPTVALRSE